MRPTAVVIPLLVLALAGCGQSGGSTTTDVGAFKGADAKVAQVIADLSEDGKGRKPGDICDDLLAKGLKQRIESAGAKCATEMRKAIEDADGFDLKVTDVEVNGTQATADVQSTDGGKKTTRKYTLRNESGTWRILRFG